jgi:hypothetical protein
MLRKLHFSVVDSGFQLDSLTRAYIPDNMNIKFRLAPELLRKPTCVCILHCLEMVGLRINWITEAAVLMINITGRSNLSFPSLALLQKATTPDRDSQDSGDLTLLRSLQFPLLDCSLKPVQKEFHYKNTFPKVTSGDDKGRRRNCSPHPPPQRHCC